MAKFLGIHHFSITVSDLDRSIKFYTEVLGGRHFGGDDVSEYPYYADIVGVEGAALDVAFIDLYGITLELIKYTAKEAPNQHIWTNNVGASHLCLRVEGIDEITENLKKAGVKIRAFNAPVLIASGPNAGIRCFYCEDPDGYPFEIFEGKLDAEN